jgi:hypothetical protein
MDSRRDTAMRVQGGWNGVGRYRDWAAGKLVLYLYAKIIELNANVLATAGIA